MIDLISVPFDLSGMRYGSRLGPGALRLAGLTSTLLSLGYEVCDRGDVASYEDQVAYTGIRNFEAATSMLRSLRKQTLDSLAEGGMPVVLGGEHSLSIGSVSAALTHCKGDLALLWIDAHADLNTPFSSPTNNLHGMPVAALWDIPNESEETNPVKTEQWNRIRTLVGEYKLRQEGTVWMGIRDVDEGESRHMCRPFKCLPITIQDIDRRGIEHTVDRFHTQIVEAGIRNLWISFDVDVLDPFLAPGTGTAVRGGLSYREGHLLAELLREKLDQKDCPYKLVGMDLVETNPIYDTNNATAIVAVEWIASLFGKTILGRH